MPSGNDLPVIVEVGTPSNETFEPIRVFGEGSESVYVYYNPSDERLAHLEPKDAWPCKIGHAAGPLTHRLISQGVTAIVYKPVVGLVLRTEDGAALEKAVHLALDEADARLDEGFGTEWFVTSPDKIASWFQAYLAAVDILRTGQSPQDKEE